MLPFLALMKFGDKFVLAIKSVAHNQTYQTDYRSAPTKRTTNKKIYFFFRWKSTSFLFLSSSHYVSSVRYILLLPFIDSDFLRLFSVFCSQQHCFFLLLFITYFILIDSHLHCNKWNTYPSGVFSVQIQCIAFVDG